MGIMDSLLGKPKPNGPRRPMMAGNWKMNKTVAQAVQLAQSISYKFDHPYDAVEIVLCPPAIDIHNVWNVLTFDSSDIKLGAQDVHWEESGAYTGCISPLMLKESHVDYCIIGHSERRGYFGETDEDVNRKAKALIAHGMNPIMCCGESLECRDAGSAIEFVTAQVRAGLEGIAADDVARSVVAYEPIWAIGTGRTATPQQAQEMSHAIRVTIADMVGQEAAEHVRVLYGGSMKPANVEQFMPMEDIDGGLIGGAALDADAFEQLVKAAE